MLARVLESGRQGQGHSADGATTCRGKGSGKHSLGETSTPKRAFRQRAASGAIRGADCGKGRDPGGPGCTLSLSPGSTSPKAQDDYVGLHAEGKTPTSSSRQFPAWNRFSIPSCSPACTAPISSTSNGSPRLSLTARTITSSCSAAERIGRSAAADICGGKRDWSKKRNPAAAEPLRSVLDLKAVTATALASETFRHG